MKSFHEGHVREKNKPPVEQLNESKQIFPRFQYSNINRFSAIDFYPYLIKNAKEIFVENFVDAIYLCL